MAVLLDTTVHPPPYRHLPFAFVNKIIKVLSVRPLMEAMRQVDMMTGNGCAQCRWADRNRLGKGLRQTEPLAQKLSQSGTCAIVWASSADPSQLFDDIDALKAMIAAAQAGKASTEQERLGVEAEIGKLKIIKPTSDERTARLASIIVMLQHAQYDTRSERLRHEPLDNEQMVLVFDEIETGIGRTRPGWPRAIHKQRHRKELPPRI